MYKKHLDKKTASQQEKEKDKTESNIQISVWTVDLQSVLTCPNTQASAMYYKTKLTVHNMTYYDLKSKQAFNYVFDETNGDLSSHMFGYLHYNHFRTFLNDNPDIKMAAAEQDITIGQKFLVYGHTQRKCDSAHSVVERKLKGCDIYVPGDLMVAVQLARQHPSPYKVKDNKWSESVTLSSDASGGLLFGASASLPKQLFIAAQWESVGAMQEANSVKTIACSYYKRKGSKFKFISRSTRQLLVVNHALLQFSMS
ncbi:hypothetical protein RRG08_003221 [Elysia crispata]|uniref:Uncharacterized protein n=1 Tax=Elysia crispata TaxID=231223 RepID=A0AAE1E6X0_9GAST|nr:hypothetical protein RRG08_003221 [Elysia crispata]